MAADLERKLTFLSPAIAAEFLVSSNENILIDLTECDKKIIGKP